MTALPTLSSLIYPACRTDNWQMDDCERLVVTGLLARLLPRCAIEVGTTESGTLSLLCQFAEIVFSIGADPEVPVRLGPMPRVSYLTGSGSVILPTLLDELAGAKLGVGLVVLSDNDFAAEFLPILLAQRPKEPQVILVQNAATDKCHRGLVSLDWEGARYVHAVDLDFVQGRRQNQGGRSRGNIRGGLAVIFQHPQPRLGALMKGARGFGL